MTTRTAHTLFEPATDAAFGFWLRAKMTEAMPQPQRYGKTIVGVSCCREGCPLWVWLTEILPYTIWIGTAHGMVSACRVGKRFITIRGKRHQMTPRMRAFVAKVDEMKGEPVRAAQALEIWEGLE